MNTKLLIIFIFFCTVQNSQAFLTLNLPSLSIDNVLTTIKNLITNVENAINEISQLLENFKDKIADIISAIDIPTIVAGIEQAINKILNTAGVTVQTADSCIQSQATAVQTLISNITNSVQQCIDDVNSTVEKLAGEIEKVEGKAQDFIVNATGSVEKCVMNHLLNPINLIGCVKDLIVPITDDANEVVDQVQSAITDSEQIIKNAINQLTTCVGNVKQVVENSENAIISNFQTCVNNLISGSG